MAEGLSQHTYMCWGLIREDGTTMLPPARTEM